MKRVSETYTCINKKYWVNRIGLDLTFLYLCKKIMIFYENHDFPQNLKNTSFLTFSTKIVSKNYFFDQHLNFSDKYVTLAPIWYFYFPPTPSSS